MGSARIWPLLALTLACNKDPDGTGQCGVGAQLVQNVCRTTCTVHDDCLLGDQCSNGVCLPGAAAPQIGLFSATPDRLPVGGDTLLTYQVSGATEIEILVDSGRGFVSFHQSTEPSGGVAYGPVSNDFIAKLVARNGNLEANAMISVAVESLPNAVRIDSFVARPSTIQTGGSAELSWQVSNLDGKVTLSGGGDQFQSTDAQGSHTVRPTETTTYVLQAEGFDGPVQAQVTVTVQADPPRASLSLKGPGSLNAGDNGVLTWESEHISEIRLFEAQREMFRTRDPGLVAKGQWLIAPRGTTTYRVEGHPDSGEALTDQISVAVTNLPAPPTISNFEVFPSVMNPDIELAQVNASWNVQGATFLGLFSGTTFSEVQPAGGVTYAQPSHETLRLLLRAENNGGVAESRRVAWAVERAREPDQLQPNQWSGSAFYGEFAGFVGQVLDTDHFSIGLEPGERLQVSLRPLGPMMGCPEGMIVTLRAGTASTQVRQDTVPSSGACISYEHQPQVAQRFEIEISMNVSAGGNRTADYMLVLDALPPTCGDGQTQGQEACDDGNRAYGDACSPDCQINPDYLYEVADREDMPSMLPVLSELPLYSLNSNDPLDEGFAVAALPFEFPFYGASHQGVAISTNGYLAFLPPSGNGLQAEPLGPAQPHATVAVFAQDLVLASDGRIAGGEVPLNGGDAAFLIELSGLQPKNGPGRFSAWVVLLPDGGIVVRYEVAQAQRLRVQAGIEGPEGLGIYTAPGCENGCTADQLYSGRLIHYFPVAVNSGS